MSYVEEIQKLGLTLEQYDLLLKDIDRKLDGEYDIDWSELCEKYNVQCHPDTLRKASSSIFGGKFRVDYLKNQIYTNPDEFSKERDLDNKLREIKKERIKLQTANVERNRIDRAEARQEMYYEFVGNMVKELVPPEFVLHPLVDGEMEYALLISDVHFGASFKSSHNEYSPEISKERFEYLCSYVSDFVVKHNIGKLNVIFGGDALQGLLRVSDLKINDSSVVKATVEISQIISEFLNVLSSVVSIDYYHVPTSNHTQLRPLGTKANQIADEDMEYVIGNYIKDSLKSNHRVNVNLAKDGDQYIDLEINGYKICAGHGHTIKNQKNSLRDLSFMRGEDYDYVILGHFHAGELKTVGESILGNKEVIIMDSFCGSDPYSDSLMLGAKAACSIIGFDEYYGHTETYKIILN